MRYPPGHKKKTRERLVKEAGRLFRANGYDRVGVDDIMAAAGLTRGGFYGYFRSKSALFAEIMRTEHGLNRLLIERPGGDPQSLTREALAIVNGYLDPANLREIGRDCTMAALLGDAARADRKARTAYTRKLDELAMEFTRGLGAATASKPDPRALAALALCVGGLALARGSTDPKLADRLLAACRDAVARELS